jgi:hypothetical protein
MIKRKHTEYEHEHDHECCSRGCSTDGYFNLTCEQNPELEEKTRQVNETIKKLMIKIKEEREARQRGEL